MVRLTKLGEKKIQFLDEDAKAEVQSILFPSLGVRSLLKANDSEGNEMEIEKSSAERVKLTKGNSEMFRVVWHKPRAEFLLCSTNASGQIILPHSTVTNTKRSTITDVRHVSYVCSPWLPTSLQIRDTNGIGKKPSRSNRDLGRKAADIIGAQLGADMGKQERSAQDALNEVLLISGVNGPRILLSQWIPGLSDNLIWELDHVLGGETSLSIARSGAGPAAANSYADRIAAHKTSKTPSVYLYSSGSRVITNKYSPSLESDGTKYAVPKQQEEVALSRLKTRSDSSIRVVELLGVDYKESKLAVTLEPGGCIDSRTKSVASDTKHGKDYCELGEFALSVAGDGSAIFGVELESIDQHLTFVKSIADVKKVSGLGVNASSLCHSLSQIQRRTSEISNALFIRGRNSSIDTNTMNYDVASGVADLLKVMYGEANNGAYMECVSKYVAIIAGQFQPFMKPPEYLDGSDYESRLSSLLGRCIEAHELSPGECIIMGSNGIFLTGKRCDRYEDLISAHVRAKAKERALNVISKRLSQLEEYIFSVSRNKSNGNKPENESVHQALTNAKRVVDLLKNSIFYDFHENENELLPITEIDRRMESPSKYDRYVKKTININQRSQHHLPSKILDA